MDDRLFRSMWGGVVLGVIGLFVLATVLISSPPVSGRSAPSGSSYGTNPQGTAALAELFKERGHRVVQYRRSLDGEVLEPGATAFVVDAVLDSDTVSWLWSFLGGGGRLVIAGGDISMLFSPEGPGRRQTRHPITFPHPDLAGVREVVTPEGITWSSSGSLLPLAGSEGAIVLATFHLGAGAFALSDPSVLSNRGLAEGDNAALALALGGSTQRPIYFIESLHGYGVGEGLSALPRRWQLALAGLGLAGVVWMIGRGRRLGPPQQADRRLPPARARYVDALAASLVRTKDRAGATQPVREALTRTLERLQKLSGVDGSDLSQVAEQLGLEAEEVRRALAPAQNDGDVLAAGRVLARLHQNRVR